MNLQPVVDALVAGAVALGLALAALGLVLAARRRPGRAGSAALAVAPGLLVVVLGVGYLVWVHAFPHPQKLLEESIGRACLTAHGLGPLASVDVFDGLARAAASDPGAPSTYAAHATDTSGRTATCRVVASVAPGTSRATFTVVG